MLPFVSVITPTFDRCASLYRLLDALADQTYPAACFEVVVVDDGSTDGTADAARSWTLPFQLQVLQQPNRGPAAARNRGVENARGELVLFLDDDVLPISDLIAAHVAAHDSKSNIVVVGPMSPPSNWPRKPWVRWEEEKLQVQYRALLAGEYPCTPRQFYTGNASISRDLLLAAGGFDANFKRAEDVELGWRLFARGVSFIFEPRADVLHYASRSFESWCRTPYQYGRYDVVMGRDKSYEVLDFAARNFHSRASLSRALAHGCVGRPLLGAAARFALQATVHSADRLRMHRLASSALSGLFNLLYWQGVCDELGGRQEVLRLIENMRFQPSSRSLDLQAEVRDSVN